MSDKTQDKTGASETNGPVEVNDVETPAAEATASEKAEPAARKSRSGRAGRRLLVLVLVSGLAALGWLYQEQRLLIAELRQQQSLQQSQLQDQQVALAGLQESYTAELSQVQQSAEEYAAQLDQQRQALQSLNQEVVGLRLGISNGQTGRDQSWLLNEAASALRLARQYLNLAGDARTATSLYQSADQLLREINDPAITALRGLLASDISLLQAVQTPDTEGLYQQLSALTERVAELPFSASTLPERFMPETVVTEAEEGFLATLRAELNQYFTVRRMDEPAVPLLGPEDMLLIRQNLQLHLEQAKLALLRGQQEIWEQSLASAQNLLAQYTEGSDQGQQVQASIDALQALDISPQVPVLSNSLTVLQDLLNAGGRQ